MVIEVTISCRLRNNVTGFSVTTGKVTGAPVWSTPVTGVDRPGASGSGAIRNSDAGIDGFGPDLVVGRDRDWDVGTLLIFLKWPKAVACCKLFCLSVLNKL
jgi:hypothetical protein